MSSPLEPGRCGMCGACGSMPPWAPEALANATPAERLAIEQRLEQARQQFIMERDSKKQQEQEFPSSSHIEEQQKNEDITITTTQSTKTEQQLAYDNDDVTNEMQQQQLSNSAESTATPTEAKTIQSYDDIDIEVDDLQTKTSENQLQSSKLIRSNESHSETTSSNKTKTPTTTRQIASTQPGTSISNLTDLDSDADSFHTADDEDEIIQNREALDVDSSKVPETDIWKEDNEIPTVSGIDIDVNNRTSNQPSISDNKSSSSQNDSSNEYDDTEEPITSENLEEIVMKKKSLHLQQNRTNFTHNTKSDFSPRPNSNINSTEPLSPAPLGTDSLQCQDCQAWRRRVVELEAKVEAMSTSLAAREMDVATLRARINEGGRYVPKSEARLIQECEGLRVTTEFLYQKLERYERTLNGHHGDVH